MSCTRRPRAPPRVRAVVGEGPYAERAVRPGTHAVEPHARGEHLGRHHRSVGWAARPPRLVDGLSRMLEGVRAVADADLAREVEDFLTAHPRPDQTKITQHIERMQVTVAQAHRTRAALA